MPRTLYMETTQIAADKSAAEISSLLTYAGATRIMIENANYEAVALAFAIPTDGIEVPFKLPINRDPIFAYLQQKRAPMNRNKKRDDDWEQALRVAWRQILQWLRAQLALIETGMVTPTEVFLPYVRGADGTTFYQQIAAGGFKQLPQFTGE